MVLARRVGAVPVRALVPVTIHHWWSPLFVSLLWAAGVAPTTIGHVVEHGVTFHWRVAIGMLEPCTFKSLWIAVVHPRCTRYNPKTRRMVILWQDHYGKGNLRKSYWNMAGRKFQIGIVSLFIVKKDYSCLCVWKTYNWLERNKILIRCGKYSTKKSILENQLHSKTMPNKQRYSGQLQNHVWIANFRGRSREITIPENLRISSWSYDMAGHAKKCVERHCGLANKTTQQLYKVSTPCIDDHHFKEEEMKSVGEWSNTCSQIVLICKYLARIGRPDIL